MVYSTGLEKNGIKWGSKANTTKKAKSTTENTSRGDCSKACPLHFNPKSQLVSDNTELVYRQRPSPCSHSLRILFSDQCCLLSGFKEKAQSCNSIFLISISTILLYKISYSSTLILSVLLLFTYWITHKTWDFLMILFKWKYVNWITVLFFFFILPWWPPSPQFKWLSIS